MKQFTCFKCKETKTHDDDFTTGYGIDNNDNKICYVCCSEDDKKHMIERGKTVLYLTKEGRDYKVTNWPESLKFNALNVRKGKHNIARTRYDVWFVGPDKHVWHGVQYGDNTQILHCKRTKEVWK